MLRGVDGAMLCDSPCIAETEETMSAEEVESSFGIEQVSERAAVRGVRAGCQRGALMNATMAATIAV